MKWQDITIDLSDPFEVVEGWPSNPRRFARGVIHDIPHASIRSANKYPAAIVYVQGNPAVTTGVDEHGPRYILDGLDRGPDTPCWIMSNLISPALTRAARKLRAGDYIRLRLDEVFIELLNLMNTTVRMYSVATEKTWESRIMSNAT